MSLRTAALSGVRGSPRLVKEKTDTGLISETVSFSANTHTQNTGQKKKTVEIAKLWQHNQGNYTTPTIYQKTYVFFFLPFFFFLTLCFFIFFFQNPGRDIFANFPLQLAQGNNQRCDTGYEWFSGSFHRTDTTHWCVSTKKLKPSSSITFLLEFRVVFLFRKLKTPRYLGTQIMWERSSVFWAVATFFSVQHIFTFTVVKGGPPN